MSLTLTNNQGQIDHQPIPTTVKEREVTSESNKTSNLVGEIYENKGTSENKRRESFSSNKFEKIDPQNPHFFKVKFDDKGQNFSISRSEAIKVKNDDLNKRINKISIIVASRKKLTPEKLDLINENIKIIKKDMKALSDLGYDLDKTVILRVFEKTVKRLESKDNKPVFKNIIIKSKFVIVKHSLIKTLNKEIESNKSNKYFLKKQVETFYENKISQFEGLKLEKKEFTEMVDEYLKLSDSFEFNINNGRFLDVLDKINKKILENNINGDPKYIKKIINELVLCNCLIPAQVLTSSNKRVQRQTIEVTSFAHMEKILKSITEQSPIDLAKNPYLNHIDEKIYQKSSLPQKLVLLNLANLSTSARQDFQKDPFTQEFMELMQKQPPSHIKEWMMACSGTLEQKYLNTCLSTCACQEVLTRVVLLPQAILLTENMLTEAKKNAEAEIQDPQMLKYFQGRVAKETKYLDQLKADILEAARSGSTAQLKEFTLRWSKSMQRIGLLNPKHIAHPTQKIVDNQWLLSVILMLPVVLFKHLIGCSTNPPIMGMRAKGTKGIESALPLSIARDFQGGLDIDAQLEKLKAIKGKGKSPKKQQTAHKIWQLINFHGGASFSIPGHAIYIKAIYLNNKPVFLVADPKSDTYQVKNFREFAKFATDNNLIYQK